MEGAEEAEGVNEVEKLYNILFRHDLAVASAQCADSMRPEATDMRRV